MTQPRVTWGGAVPIALILALIFMSLGTAGFVTPASAAPSQETASSSVSISNSVMGPADEGPSPRFGFNSVLDQATTTVTKTICPSVGNCANGTASRTLSPGQLVDFLVTVVPGPGFPNGSIVTLADFWTNGLIFQSADNCGPSGITGPTPPGFNNSTFCDATVQNGIVQVVMHFSAATNVTVPSTALNEACVGAPSLLSGPTICSSPPNTINFSGPTATPTVTATATATPTVTPTSTTTLTPGPTATLPPSTGTLVVCKQLVFPGSPGGTSGIGGIGGIGGVGPVNPLQLQSNTFTFTTSPVVTIPAITVPAGTTTAVCATGVAIAAGTVTITENVPAGFVLASVTGGTQSGNSATATITAGQTTTVTFINDPAVTVIPNNLPLLPPPPLQFVPPPPPPLLPPPPPAPPTGRAMAPPGGVPVIPEADSLFLVIGGLVALGGLVGLRSLRRRDDAG